MALFRPLLVFVLLLASTGAVRADTWSPYTDGRVGGCWINAVGQMYGCTPQPPKPPPPSRPADPEIVYRDRGPTQDQVDRAIDRAVKADRAAQARAEADAYYYEQQQRETAAKARALNDLRANADNERARVNGLERSKMSCKDKLAEMGFKVVAGGACRDSSGAFVTCPACPE